MNRTTWNPTQITVLAALLDAAFQPHTKEEVEEIMSSLPTSASEEHRRSARFIAETAYSQLPGAIDVLVARFKTLSAKNYNDLGLTLTLLSTRIGTLILTGFGSPFITLTLQQRESILQSWASSRILMLRQAFKAFIATSMFVSYTDVEQVVIGTGYPAKGDPLRITDTDRIKPSYPFQFETLDKSTPYKIINVEILVCGSGAGGGVVASQLSKSHQVLVIDKGQYIPTEDLEGTPAAGFRDLYENGGLMASETGSINVLAGSNFGGGTTVNWSASLRTQHFIRENWAKAYGLPHFLSEDFTKSLDFVCDRMGVDNAKVELNIPNKALVDASTKLGYHAAVIPQNAGGTPHSCGFCSFGCPFGEKQGGVSSWLVDSAKNGAKFLQKATIDRLLFATSHSSKAPTQATLANFTPSSSRTVCIGALIIQDGGATAIVIASKAVVVSAGTINSPAILLRSGLKNSRIGKNLHLHPCSYMTGFFDKDISPWTGSIMTGLSNVVENRDGSHHGAKIEVMMSFPGGTGASFVGWTSSKAHKASMIAMKNSFTLLALARDKHSGRIVLDAEKQPRIEYDVSSYDALSILQGIIKGCEILLVAGANRIVTAQVGIPDYYPAVNHLGLVDPAWLEWIGKVEKAGAAATFTGHGSAHQMGTNSMGSNSSNSVVDARSRVWGTESLYIADASIFPTASGVNPMITNMALSYSVSQFINQDLASTSTGLRASL